MRLRVVAAVLALLALALFAADTALSWHHLRLGFDLPVERSVQAIDWGPLQPLMNATDWLADYKEAIACVLLTAALWPLTHRGALVFLSGAVASAVEEIMKRVVQAPRPSPDLVSVQTPESSYGFPSGHATFFTWTVLLLLIVLNGWIPRPLRPLAWLLGAFVIFTASLGRIWSGEHWPSQVIGGFLLGAGWALLVGALSGSVRWRGDETRAQS